MLLISKDKYLAIHYCVAFRESNVSSRQRSLLQHSSKLPRNFVKVSWKKITLFINTESHLSFPLYLLQHAFAIVVYCLRTAVYPKILPDVRMGIKWGRKGKREKSQVHGLCPYAFFPPLPAAFCQIKICSESAIVLKCLRQFISLSQLILVLVIKQKVNTFLWLLLYIQITP